ncbi:MAG: PEP-CTERM sorting domain-containing protein [Candidatus Brocadiaceae bacterium]|nr:PEP-CTERM sorting domain-containing protein [Candidatus Brocadiaceae bacterium]
MIVNRLCHSFPSLDDPLSGVTALVSIGRYSHRQASNVFGKPSVLWKFNPRADLTGGGTQLAFVIDVLSADYDGASVDFTLTDGVGAVSTSSVSILSGLNKQYSFDFASFAGAADFSDTSTLLMEVDGSTVANLQLTVDMISTVPEPGTVALLGIGLAGLIGVGARRRAKKKAA